MSSSITLALADVAKSLTISKQTLLRRIDDGSFGPCVHSFGKRRMVSAAELQAWVDAGMPSHKVWLAMSKAASK